MYKNVFNLIPRWLGGLRKLKTLKFFGNEVNIFPTEFRNLVEPECLQLKITSPSLTGLPLHKLMALKELELCKVSPRPSAFPLLSEIAGLKCLTKLSVCHFSIRYFPYRSVLFVECMPVENVANFCFYYLRRMMRKTFNFGLCYFEL
ncbi:hypothetical protein ACSBR1_042928 [Camellia fascicularis]